MKECLTSVIFRGTPQWHMGSLSETKESQCGGKGACLHWAGMQISTAIVENRITVPQKMENRITASLSNPATGCADLRQTKSVC